MNLQRIIFALAIGLQASLAGAIGNNTFPAWTPYLILVALFVTNLMQALTQSIAIPPTNPASKVSTSFRPPPLPVLMMTMIVGFVCLLAGCGATPAQVKAIESVVDFVEQDACVMATDFAPSTSTQTVAEVCGYVQQGTAVAEDIVNHIEEQRKAKARSQDPALKAKYAQRYAAVRK